MFKSRLLCLATALCAAALVCLVVCPRPAAADDILTISFTGTTGPCFEHPGFRATPCSSIPANTTVTGTYSFDETTQSIVGPWSFSTFFGVASGTGPSFQGTAYRLFFFEPGNTIFLTFSNPDGYGTLVTGLLPNTSSMFASYVGSYTNDETEFGFTSLDIISGQATPVSTPEPATLLLLGTGLLAFTPPIRRHFGQGV